MTKNNKRNLVTQPPLYLDVGVDNTNYPAAHVQTVQYTAFEDQIKNSKGETWEHLHLRLDPGSASSSDFSCNLSTPPRPRVPQRSTEALRAEALKQSQGSKGQKGRGQKRTARSAPQGDRGPLVVSFWLLWLLSI